ncbi:MAG: sigma-54-dependent Fis family transcriptional regulator [Planctomycetes bacterium]|nr:sigma-54-dependent Fis family transcriptional regulator [Planctomycetota bacterium]
MSDTSFILIVEDEAPHGEVLKEGLERAGHACHLVDSADAALASIRHRAPHVIVSDYRLGGNMTGLDLLAEARAISPWTQGILITAHGDEQLARDAFKAAGVFDYLKKPLDLEMMRTQVSSAARQAKILRENYQLAHQHQQADAFEGIIAASGAMKSVLHRVRKLARTKLTVVIYGESGTGKELIARAIHNNSDRKKKPWVAVNCAGISEGILESELFGHIKGSFTNASADRRGYFEEADGGTIFLDEIGDMPVAMQSKLLRVLENGEVLRVGSSKPVHVDVRVVAATNRNLKELIVEKKFREDLFFRINQAEINLLPLRDRPEDLPPLIFHFVQQANTIQGTNVKKITPEALHMLTRYRWPGNVRELQNVINQIVAMCEGETIDVRDLPSTPPINATTDIVPVTTRGYANITLRELEKLAIQHALAKNQGNREKAAKDLGIGARTLYRKLREFDLS